MKKTLLVIDMQNDFVYGCLGTKEAAGIVENVKRKLAACRARGDEIIFTRDTHGADYLETSEGRYLPVVHCIKGTEGWQLVEGLYQAGDTVIDKPTFGYTGWNAFDFADVELIGVCTDICVVSNALILKAQFPEIRIGADASCCAGVTPEKHAAALETMRSCQVDVR